MKIQSILQYDVAGEYMRCYYAVIYLNAMYPKLFCTNIPNNRKYLTYLHGGIYPSILGKLRDHYSHFAIKSFTAGVPPLQFRPPEIKTLQGKGRLVPMVDAEQIVQFTQRCRIQFATTATGP